MVQSPFYPAGEGGCHVYLLHPPGGLVAGDQLSIAATAEAGTQVLLTTPAATKLYRSDGRVARATNRVVVGEASALEWLPHESIAFPGVNARIHTRIELAPTSRFIGWEHWCLGLPARDETFREGCLESRLSVFRARAPVLLERQAIAGGGPALRAAWGFAGYPVGGTLLAYPAERAPAQALRTACDTFAGGRAGFTQVGGLAVVRALAPSTHALAGLWHSLWSLLRPAVIGQPAQAPRIWAT